MKRKKYSAFVVCVVILFATILTVAAFLPRPIIEEVSNSRIVWIHYNPYFHTNRTDYADYTDARSTLADYDEKEILTCLSQYKEYRTLNRNSGYALDRVELEILLHTGDELKSIVLGTENRSSGSNRAPNYKILDADTLRVNLIKIMDISGR